MRKQTKQKRSTWVVIVLAIVAVLGPMVTNALNDQQQAEVEEHALTVVGILEVLAEQHPDIEGIGAALGAAEILVEELGDDGEPPGSPGGDALDEPTYTDDDDPTEPTEEPLGEEN